MARCCNSGSVGGTSTLVVIVLPLEGASRGETRNRSLAESGCLPPGGEKAFSLFLLLDLLVGRRLSNAGWEGKSEGRGGEPKSGIGADIDRGKS